LILYIANAIATVLLLIIIGVSLWWLIFYKVLNKIFPFSRKTKSFLQEAIRDNLSVECKRDSRSIENLSHRFVYCENDRYRSCHRSTDEDRRVFCRLGTIENRKCE